jgi:propionyl-CoA carboxylase alpha chain
MITRVLVANRGEIARRVFATCRRLGIETVAVHSDADAGLPFVAEADVAVRLPGNAPSETYLRGELIIEAARRTGADAIHPGYGFLSENAEFARAVEAAGLIWVGPTPKSIEAMGSKIEAKRIMKDAGVPVLEDTGDFPVLIKASAGGGGRGMRIVRRPEDLAAELATAEAEAASAFGDGTVFVEPYVERSRHVEVQVVGDRFGEVIVLGERDCSLQRRHQKVVEEAPAPNLAAEVATALHDSARRAAEATGYIGAGTVEFLYDADTERFYFLEMNTRLQVEHPVTEAVFGVDLVELQLRVADGGSLAEAEVMAPRGHAIEARLYAEDPAADYQPQSGLLTTFDVPSAWTFEQPGRGVRVDAGFGAGDEVSTHYDALLAKVIAWAPTRREAARMLAAALRRARIHGVVTNRDQLVDVMADPDFLAGDVSTELLANGTHGLLDRTSLQGWSAIAAAIAIAENDRLARTVQQGIPVAWRNVTSQPQRTEFLAAGVDEPLVVPWHGGRDGYLVDGATVRHAGADAVTLEVDGLAATYTVAISGEVVDVDSPGGHVRLTRVARFIDPADAIPSGSLLAPMPGTVVKVAVADGDEVEAGDVVLVLEAMKMQHTIAAPSAGRVTTLNAQPGQQVASGDVLAIVEITAVEGDDA